MPTKKTPNTSTFRGVEMTNVIAFVGLVFPLTVTYSNLHLFPFENSKTRREF